MLRVTSLLLFVKMRLLTSPDKHLGGTIPTFKNVKSSLHEGLGTGKITTADRFPCDFYPNVT
jgi:hypothetical protein